MLYCRFNAHEALTCLVFAALPLLAQEPSATPSAFPMRPTTKPRSAPLSRRPPTRARSAREPLFARPLHPPRVSQGRLQLQGPPTARATRSPSPSRSTTNGTSPATKHRGGGVHRLRRPRRRHLRRHRRHPCALNMPATSPTRTASRRIPCRFSSPSRRLRLEGRHALAPHPDGAWTAPIWTA